MDKIKCKYCGKEYPSPSEAHKRSCRYHPKGCWKGCCTGEMATELMWKMNRQWEEQDKQRAEIERQKQEENAAIMAKRPILFVGKSELWYNRHIEDKDTRLRCEDLNVHPYQLANEIILNWKELIGKNTVEDLVACCRYALEHYTGKNGRLANCDFSLQRMTRYITEVEFWEKTYWFMKAVPEKIGEKAAKDITCGQLNNRLCEVLNNKDRAKSLIDAYSSALLSLSVDAHNRKISNTWEVFLNRFSQRVTRVDWWDMMYTLLRLDLHPK